MSQLERLAIIGAGPASIAFSYYWKFRGGAVLVYTHPDHQKTSKRAKLLGYVRVNDEGHPHRIRLDFTSSAIDTFNFSKTLAWSVRGDVRDPLYEQLRGLDFSEHTVIFFPGFREELNLPETVKFNAIYQTASTPLSALREEDGINIVGRKHTLAICGSDGADHKVAEDLLGVNLRWVFNEIDLSLQNLSGLFHVVLMTGNSDRISRGERWLFYKEGLTTSVVEGLSEIYDELCGAREDLRYETFDLMFLINEVYPYDFKSLEDFRDRSPVHGNVMGPVNFDHRMFYEDVQVHMVYWYDLLCILGRPANRLEKEIRKAGELVNRDFLQEGSQLRRKGLSSLTREEFIQRFGRPKD